MLRLSPPPPLQFKSLFAAAWPGAQERALLLISLQVRPRGAIEPRWYWSARPLVHPLSPPARHPLHYPHHAYPPAAPLTTCNPTHALPLTTRNPITHALLPPQERFCLTSASRSTLDALGELYDRAAAARRSGASYTPAQVSSGGTDPTGEQWRDDECRRR